MEQAGTGINRMKEVVKNHKKKIELDIQYGKDRLFYSLIFRKGLVENLEEGLVENAKESQQTKSKKIKKYSYFKELSEDTGLVENLAEGLAENLEEGLVENQHRILEFMFKDPYISKQNLAETLGISTTAIDKNISNYSASN